MLEYLQAAVLGIVEGLTEFLPVSSTGHLILAEDALAFDLPVKNMFTVVIQLGAILSVCWLYRARLFEVILNLNDKKQQSFVLNLFVAFLPAAIIGLAFHHVIEEQLFSPLVVAISLVIGGFIILAVEKWKPMATTGSIDAMTLKQALLIGCAQAVAVIPGTSRSGATIIGGLLTKLDRKTATEFSFFLAIPVMCAATLLDVIKYHTVLTMHDLVIIAIGFVVSFLSGLAAVTFFVRFVGQHSFVPFALYRIVFGGAMFFYYAL